MNPLLLFIVVFAVVDLAVTTIIIRKLLARKAAGQPIPFLQAASRPSLSDVRGLREFTDAIHPRLGELVRSNWSGDEASLVTVLPMALDEADREAKSRGLTLDRIVLKKLVEASLARHRIAHGSQIREALQRVA